MGGAADPGVALGRRCLVRHYFAFPERRLSVLLADRWAGLNGVIPKRASRAR